MRNQPVMVAVVVEIWTKDDRAVSGRGSEEQDRAPEVGARQPPSVRGVRLLRVDLANERGAWSVERVRESGRASARRSRSIPTWSGASVA